MIAYRMLLCNSLVLLAYVTSFARDSSGSVSIIEAVGPVPAAKECRVVKSPFYRYFGVQTINDLVSKETGCCVDGKVKHLSKLSN